jgi:precorrin-2/cobalt-factor-2 C20-methyltransferase
METGTLYGIGVGPGDPELITVKAVRILKQVDLIFTADSTKNDYSVAVGIARPHLPEDIEIRKLSFPMSKNEAIKEQAWQQNAELIAEVLKKGLSAAFLTLGDPLTYSTFGYMVRYVKKGWPELEILTIPGITSYQAAAAALNRPLVEGEESLLIMSGAYGGNRFHNMPVKPDNVVFLKAYRNIEGICKALKDAKMLASSVAVSNCTQEDQKVYEDIEALSREKPNYWTLILAKHELFETQREK